jgi:hypothetical protein
MSELTDEETWYKAHDIVSAGDDYHQKFAGIHEYYLALLGNPNYSDCSPKIMAKKAMEHYSDAQYAITNEIVLEFIKERFG